VEQRGQGERVHEEQLDGVGDALCMIGERVVGIDLYNSDDYYD